MNETIRDVLRQNNWGASQDGAIDALIDRTDMRPSLIAAAVADLFNELGFPEACFALGVMIAELEERES